MEDTLLCVDIIVIPKDYKAYTAQLKKVYGASSLKAAEAEFERFRQAWSQYPGAVDVWNRNWTYVEQLYNYGSAIRKVMYTTNARISQFQFQEGDKERLFSQRRRCPESLISEDHRTV